MTDQELKVKLSTDASSMVRELGKVNDGIANIAQNASTASIGVSNAEKAITKSLEQINKQVERTSFDKLGDMAFHFDSILLPITGHARQKSTPR